MSAAERQRRRRARLAGLDRHAAPELDHDRAARQLRAQLTQLERENQQLRERLQEPRPAIAPTPAPSSHSAPAAGWLNRIVVHRKR